MQTNRHLDLLRENWQAQWPHALALWSRFTKLSEPNWCFSRDDEQRQGLSGSFAMIRLADQAIVIGLEQIAWQKLDDYGLEILAHE
ncbi:MAG TPA: hypothetical protein VF719_08490, partial [Abditibacteriaceae bacterium]